MIAPLVALKRLRSRRLYRNRKGKKKIAVDQIPSVETATEESQHGKMSALPAKAGPLAKAPKQKKASHIQGFDGFKDKRPFALRVNPFIEPTHESFLDMETYFRSLLRSTKLTIEEILESNFESHEVLLFTPATQPPQLVRWQKDSTRRYQALLKTRFKDHTPSLEFKMTLLYFGLPVEPMRPGAQEIPKPMDLDLDTDELITETDPLKFLDDCTTRTYGKPALSLRGGGLFDNEDSMALDEEFPEEETSPADGQAEKPAAPRECRVYGYQGSLYAPSLTYGEFVKRTDQLLGRKDTSYDYEICVEVFNEGTDFTHTSILDRARGMLRHYRNVDETPPTHDPIYSLLVRNFQNGSGVVRGACFVRYSKESLPIQFAPPYQDRYVLRLWDPALSGMSYMRVPEQLHPNRHLPNQAHDDYLRAMKTLYPTSPHMHISHGSGQGGLSYGLLDPPPSVWGEVANKQKNMDEGPMLHMQTTNISWDFVAILIPGFHNYPAGLAYQPGAQGDSQYPLWKKELKINGMQRDRDGLLKLFRDVKNTNPALDDTQEFIGVDVWFPGENFLEIDKEPGRIPTEDYGDAQMALAEWRALVLSWPGDQAYREFRGLSMVARPVFSEYRLRSASGPENVKMNIDTITLSEFKTLVKESLFPNYDPQDETQVLHLTQTTWPDAKPEFAIRHQSKEADWQWVLRNITEPDITVALQTWENEWAIPEDAIWGPRYDTADLKELSNYEVSKPKPDSSAMDHFFRNSMNSETAAERSEALRKHFFWNVPGIFTNPTKPVMPIHGPPLESIIRTGPSMPGVSIGMMTPTEMARLQLEVHSLRNQLLDRTRECPYLDCKRYFRFDDGYGLDRHLKKDHQILKCFLCTKNEFLLPWHDSRLVRQHFLTEHFDEFKTLFGNASHQPSTQSSGSAHSSTLQGSLAHYCDRCGRDQSVLDHAADRLHHSMCCIPYKTDESVKVDKYCKQCGGVLVASEDSWTDGLVSESCAFGHSTNKSDSDGPDNYCALCGLRYDDSMDQAYREVHKGHCRIPRGYVWDYCAYCAVNLSSLSAQDRSTHGWHCEKKPPAGAGSPKENLGTSPTTIADKRCKLFDLCGVVTTHMTKQQVKDHMGFHKYMGHTTDSPAPPGQSKSAPPSVAGGDGTTGASAFPTPKSSAANSNKSGQKKSGGTLPSPDLEDESLDSVSEDEDDDTYESASGDSSENSSSTTSTGSSSDGGGPTNPYSWGAQGTTATSQVSKHKRKRPSGGNEDPSYHVPAGTEAEPEEEHSEAGAAPDPVANLDPNAPRSPKKRATAKKSVRIGTASALKPKKPEAEAPYFSMPPPPLPPAIEPNFELEPKTPGRRGRKAGTAAAPQTTPATVTRAGRSVRITRAAQETLDYSATAVSASEASDTSAAPATTRARGGRGKAKAGDDDGEFQLPKTPGRRGRVAKK